MKTKNEILKWLLLLMLFAGATEVWAQPGSTSPTQTVCVGSQPYVVDPPSGITGSTYTWTLSGGGSITSGNGTNSIFVNWTIPGGPYDLSVIRNDGNCDGPPQIVAVTVIALPTVTISYAGTPFCMSLTTPQPVTINGTGTYTGGIYSALPAGLTIDPATGDITPSASTAGTYTVTYTIPATVACSLVQTTTTVIITPAPTATISYSGSPFCMSLTTPQSVTINGTGAYTGGTYSALPAGLTIDPVTGEITPSTSTAGTYTVIYTIPASAGCAAEPVTTTVTIESLPATSPIYHN